MTLAEGDSGTQSAFEAALVLLAASRDWADFVRDVAEFGITGLMKGEVETLDRGMYSLEWSGEPTKRVKVCFKDPTKYGYAQQVLKAHDLMAVRQTDCLEVILR